MENAPKREQSIDIVKAIAALIMVLSHTGTALRADLPVSEFLSPILGFIDIITFSILYFLSGSGIYLATLRHDISESEFAQAKPKIFKKALAILGGYYLLAIISDFSKIFLSGADVLTELLKILLFYRIPEYTEYLLIFVLTYILILFSRRIVKRIVNKFLFTLLVSAIIYGAAIIIYKNDFPIEFSNLKLLFVGLPGRYSFPLLQYLPLFLFGAYWVDFNVHKENRLKHSKLLSFALTVVIFLIFLLIQFISSGNVTLANRWPPDLVFISFGLSVASGLLFATTNLPTNKYIDTISKNLFVFFITHMLAIFAIRYWVIPTTGGITNPFIVIALASIVSVISYLCTFFFTNNRVVKKFRVLLNKTYFDEIIIRVAAVLLVLTTFALAIFRILPQPAILIEQNPDNFDPKVAQMITQRVNLEAKLDRKWILNVSENTKFDDYRAGILNITVTDPGFGYWGVEVLVDGQVVKSFPYNRINIYNYAIYAKDLEIGTHKVAARLTGTQKITSESEFIVSEPLYVTWTIDWEGYDVSDANLAIMDKVSKDFKLPIVQLVTPRTFIAGDVPDTSKVALKNWLLQRVIKGDEIGMHLHMHLDLVEYCGITPRITPKWDGRANGHDVLTSAYTQEEFGKLVACSLKYFEEINLPKPVTYRAGGWFIDLKNLKVLPKYGFLYDTSGREAYKWGVATGFWTLSPTTKPYMISNTDQNKGDAKNNFGLIEVPNNGLDTTNNSADLMFSKFEANYPNKGSALKEMQVLTYMTHPHWMTTIDKPRIFDLFNRLTPYTANNDTGPIVYTTIKDIYSSNQND